MSVAVIPLLTVLRPPSAVADAVQTLPKGVLPCDFSCHVNWYPVYNLAAPSITPVTNEYVQVMQSLLKSL